jgi:hypothetical protein
MIRRKERARWSAVRWAAVLGAVVTVTACNVLRPPVPPTATAEPPTATPVPPPTATPEPVGNGTVTGAIGYPSEVIPPLTLYFQNIETDDVLLMSTREDQESYSKTLPPGTYYVYAWLQTGGLGGGYTAAVPCGLTAECSDHSLLPVEVAAGETTGGVAVTDWYGPPGAVPLPPGTALSMGRIAGRLAFPSEGIPPLAVYARNVASGETIGVGTEENQESYTIEDVPAGVYYVFAWVSDGNGIGGAYTQAVLCGLAAECTDHSLIEVPVAGGQTTQGVDITDWYEQSVVPLP